MNAESPAESIRRALGGALQLDLAYIGVVNDLFPALRELGRASVEALRERTGLDAGYLRRWCEAAYAFELLDQPETDRFSLSAFGAAFCADAPDTLLPAAVQAVLSAHMAERAAGLMRSGERPGEQVLAERETVLPWFGPMLELQFGPLLDAQILGAVPEFAELDRHGGLAVDLGCGNGWYLRRLARRFPGVRGVGLDGFEENIAQARRRAQAEGLAERLEFRCGDIHAFDSELRADLIAMNRALHHVWEGGETVFRTLKKHLRPGGVAAIWEPAWPERSTELREPARRAMAFQNLSEHVQGNRFLRPEEVVHAFAAVDMPAKVYRFADGKEAMIVARRVD